MNPEIKVKEKKALNDLKDLIGAPIPELSYLSSFAFGFTTKNGHVVRLGLPEKGLTVLPESFGDFTSLQEVVLFGNELVTLPESFGDLKSLRFLNLVRNKLSILPESFGNLNSIQILFINDNKLKTLPESFGQLKSLQRLNLSNNQLVTLPRSFSNLLNLELLWIEQNPLDEKSKKILKQLNSLNVIIDKL